MSSALDKMVPVFTGSNWQQWHTAMQAYLRAQGQWFIFSTPRPADESDSWDEHNEKALGNITLRVSPSIQTAIATLATVKEVWDHLKENYGTPQYRLCLCRTQSTSYDDHPCWLASRSCDNQNAEPLRLPQGCWLRVPCQCAGDDNPLQAPSYHGGCSSDSQPDLTQRNQVPEARWDRQGGNPLL